LIREESEIWADLAIGGECVAGDDDAHFCTWQPATRPRREGGTRRRGSGAPSARRRSRGRGETRARRTLNAWGGSAPSAHLCSAPPSSASALSSSPARPKPWERVRTRDHRASWRTAARSDGVLPAQDHRWLPHLPGGGGRTPAAKMEMAAPAASVPDNDAGSQHGLSTRSSSSCRRRAPPPA